MLTFFNRRLLTTTCSAKRLLWMRETLDNAGVRSLVRTPGEKKAKRAEGQQRYFRYQYNIYVYREDFERALETLRSARQTTKEGELT